MSGSPELSRSEAQLSAESTLKAFRRAETVIDTKGARIHAYYISAQIGDLVENYVPIEALEIHTGTVEGHGEFDLLMIRGFSTNRSLLRDWIILPNGQIWTCGVNQANPDLLELDTLELPTNEELVQDRKMLMDTIVPKTGLVIDPKTGEYKKPETFELAEGDSDEGIETRQLAGTGTVAK